MGKYAGRSSTIVTLETKRAIGQWAEEEAYIFLTEQGLRLIARNYLCKVGEIDLIMQDGANLVFIEVRCRKPSLFGTAAETVTLQKQHKLIKTAQYYLQQHKLSQKQVCRFDVVAITADKLKLQISWIKDAFQA